MDPLPCQALVKEVELCSRIKAHPHVVRLLGACLGGAATSPAMAAYTSAPVAGVEGCTSSPAAAACVEGHGSALAEVTGLAPRPGDDDPLQSAWQASRVGRL